MQNPIGEADLEWILHRNCEGTEQLQKMNQIMKIRDDQEVIGYAG